MSHFAASLQQAASFLQHSAVWQLAACSLSQAFGASAAKTVAAEINNAARLNPIRVFT